MTQTTSFALRIAPELKQAAKALTGPHFYEWETGEDGVRRTVGSSPTSINDAFAYLIRHGLQPVLAILQAEKADVDLTYEAFAEAMEFLLANPSKDATDLSIYPEGGHTREIVANYREEPPSADDTDATVRHFVSSEFSLLQRQRIGLAAAIGAVQRAIEKPKAEREERHREFEKAQARRARQKAVIDGLKSGA
ncbi:hypothetical protein [Aquibium oceanicum]|uniref:Uncharacterized protein n=1 Tax=Aquibium oceanicum TaxID=1670800 RepID=A0A1L3SXC3_9HYPH|nr:hypothetical protein [Aquibium oceanicum]APH74083.1 hypothetical protein BSQ44_23980 [Aquibium oceanicum]